MKDLRIFVASSRELERERNELAFLVLAKEEEFAARGLRVRLAKWEYVDPKMTEARTEDLYLEEMYDCDAAFVLFRDIVGMYTREELEKALAKERAGTTRLKAHRILFAADGKPGSDAEKLRASLPEGSYGIWSTPDELRDAFLKLVDRVAACEGLVEAPSEKYVRKITAFLAADGELAEERNAFADTVLNVNDLLEQAHRNIRVQLKFYDPANAESVIESSEMGLVLYGTNYRVFGRKEIERIYAQVNDETRNPKRFYVFFRNWDEATEKSLDEAFRSFRSDFVTKFGHFTCQFGDANALRLGFLLSLERYAGESVELYSTVGTPTAPVFVGREKELRQLHDLLDPVPGKFPAGRLPVITGAGGTGKSELVRQYASQLRVQYPGGVFQVDMERRKTWDEAFLGLLDDVPNNGVKVKNYLELESGKNDREESGGSEPITGAKVRDALLKKARSTGPMLLVLDNVESFMPFLGRDGGFAKAFPSGFSERVLVNVVATARVCDAMLRPEDWAVPFPLSDLSPDDALELLLGDRTGVDAAERAAAGRVAELLGHRALYLRRVPALIGDLYAETICDSYSELAAALEENLLGTVAEETEDTHLPDVLWTMTRERLLKMPLGAECVKLAQVASFFSPDGFPQHILAHLWKTVVAPGKDERKFARAVEILHHHNLFQSTEPVRIHLLDRAAILQTAKADPGLEEAVGKALASYEGMSPDNWLLLADHIGILRFIPDEFRSRRDCGESFQVKILCINPAFQEKCRWEQLEGDDWVKVLVRQPHIAARCPWDKLDGGNWAYLLAAKPQFSDRCAWEKLDGWCWTRLLESQPQFATLCPWQKLDGWAWAELLGRQPQFADNCAWEKLDGNNWAVLLCCQPQFADKCAWQKLDVRNWADLLGCQPHFIGLCPLEKLESRDWVILLGGETRRAAIVPDVIRMSKGQPHFADRCPWGKLDGRDWTRLLSKQPQFADRCPWEQLTWDDWRRLLFVQPQFVDHCPCDEIPHGAWVDMLCHQPRSPLLEHCPWSKFDRDDWSKLLKSQPQFADRCPWEAFDGENWAGLLAEQPQFSNRCNWEKLNGENWCNLLSDQQQFADKCPWERLDGRNWASLLAAEPQFSDRCAWEKLDGVDWVYLLCNQPQFTDRCCQSGRIGELPGWVLVCMLCGKQRPGFEGDYRDFSDELEWIVLENLLAEQPKFANSFPWENLDGGDWSWLLCQKAQFGDKCDWTKLSEDDWETLLEKQPQFAEKRMDGDRHDPSGKRPE